MMKGESESPNQCRIVMEKKEGTPQKGICEKSG
jgi:hypothetical protein